MDLTLLVTAKLTVRLDLSQTLTASNVPLSTEELNASTALLALTLMSSENAELTTARLRKEKHMPEFTTLFVINAMMDMVK